VLGKKAYIFMLGCLNFIFYTRTGFSPRKTAMAYRRSKQQARVVEETGGVGQQPLEEDEINKQEQGVQADGHIKEDEQLQTHDKSDGGEEEMSRLAAADTSSTRGRSRGRCKKVVTCVSELEVRQERHNSPPRVQWSSRRGQPRMRIRASSYASLDRKKRAYHEGVEFEEKQSVQRAHSQAMHEETEARFSEFKSTRPRGALGSRARFRAGRSHTPNRSQSHLYAQLQQKREAREVERIGNNERRDTRVSRGPPPSQSPPPQPGPLQSLHDVWRDRFPITWRMYESALSPEEGDDPEAKSRAADILYQEMYDSYPPEAYHRDQGEGHASFKGDADAAGTGGWSRSICAPGSPSSAAYTKPFETPCGASSSKGGGGGGGAASFAVRSRSPRSRHTSLAAACLPPGAVPAETGPTLASSTAGSTAELPAQAACGMICIDLTLEDDHPSSE